MQLFRDQEDGGGYRILVSADPEARYTGLVPAELCRKSVYACVRMCVLDACVLASASMCAESVAVLGPASMIISRPTSVLGNIGTDGVRDWEQYPER